MRHHVTHDRKQHRVWLAGWRLHHGLVGLLVAVVGTALMVHDWRDRHDWFTGRYT